jgi:hypothetical protein
MSAIGPGDWLICADATGCEAFDAQLVHGQEYQIATVWDYLPHLALDMSWMECAVTLVGVPDPRPELAWGLHRFKPKNDPLQALVSPAERVTEAA